MTIDPYYEKCLLLSSLEDDARFAAWTDHLPVREEATPFHCGPHSLRSLEMAYRLAGSPESVLEIGFCLGHSASIFFGLGAEHVTSIEISERRQTHDAARAMKYKFGKRFQILFSSAERLTDWRPEQKFGLGFIDGGHEFKDVIDDTALCLRLGVPHLLYDDLWQKWGPGVQPAIQHHSLVPIAILGGMALCTRAKEWK